MIRQAVTMRQVAERAGVSLKTVSRVVNEEAGVSPELVERVQAAMSELGYRPNMAAGNLRRGRTHSIAVLVQDIANDFSAATLRAIDAAAVEAGFAVFTASLDEEASREHDLVSNLVSRRIDGLVLMPATTDQSYLQTDLDRGLSVVIIDREPHGLAVDGVLADNRGGARTATEHLITHGHRRIALLGDDSAIWSAAERRDGHLEALAAHSLSATAALSRTGLRNADEVAAATIDLFSLPDDEAPTAIFAARNVCSIGAVRALQDLGREKEIALIGYDDFPLSELLQPRVSVVRQNPVQIGQTAARYLLERVAGSEQEPRKTFVPTELVARGSGEIRPHR